MAPTPDGTHHDSRQKLSAQTIHELRAPLTVIKAQAQMVKRWVMRNNLEDREVIQNRLDVIDAMVTRLVKEMDERREDRHSDGTEHEI